jgi:hypothetical protein
MCVPILSSGFACLAANGLDIPNWLKTLQMILRSCGLISNKINESKELIDDQIVDVSGDLKCSDDIICHFYSWMSIIMGLLFLPLTIGEF